MVRILSCRRPGQPERRCGARRQKVGRSGCAAATPDALAGADLIVDALFGAGLDRPVEGLARAMIEAMNAQAVAGRCCRPAERHQRNIGRGDGRCRERGARPSRSSAKNLAIFCCRGGFIAGRSIVADIGIPASVLARIAPRDIRKRANTLALEISGAAARRPQIRPRPRGRGVRAVMVDGRGAAGRARRIARRRRPRHHRKPARGACGQRRREPCRHGAAGRWRCRTDRVSRRPAPERARDRARRRRRRGDLRTRARCTFRRPRGRARRRCDHEFCAGARAARRRDQGERSGRPRF